MSAGAPTVGAFIPPEPQRRRTSWNAAELMATEFPPPRWAVPGLVPEGLSFLAGAPKLGKSWLALNLAVAVASGGVALGRIPVEAGDVLLLALEDVPRRLKERLTRVLAGSPPPERLTITTECEAIPDGGAERIRRWLTAHPGARLVVVDVFARVRGRSDQRASLYDQDYGAAARLKALADEFGVPFVVVHHVRKAAAEDFLDALSGTSGLAGAADAVLVLTRSRGASQATLKLTGRDVEEAEFPLAFDASIGTWTLLEGPASDYELQDTRRRIVQYLRDEGPSTPTRIAEALELNPNTVKVTVRRMVEAGQVDTDGAGHYFDPPLSLHETPVTGVTEGGLQR